MTKTYFMLNSRRLPRDECSRVRKLVRSLLLLELDDQRGKPAYSFHFIDFLLVVNDLFKNLYGCKYTNKCTYLKDGHSSFFYLFVDCINIAQ